MHKTLVSLLLATCLVWGQSGLLAPRAGVVRDAEGALRAVWGIRGNFVVGAPAIETTSAAASGRFVMATSGTEILVLDAGLELLASQPSPGSAVLFAFTPEGDPMLVHVPSSGATYRWTRSALAKVGWRPDGLEGTPVALAASGPGTVAIILDLGGSSWLVRRSIRDGRVLSQATLPGVSAPVYLHHDGTLLFVDQRDLVVRNAGGIEQRLPLPDDISRFEQMGANWVHLCSAGGSAGFAVHLEPGGSKLFHLPGGSP
jgi:hypothetical protein